MLLCCIYDDVMTLNRLPKLPAPREGTATVPGGFPLQRDSVTDPSYLFVVNMDELLNRQCSSQWFDTPWWKSF